MKSLLKYLSNGKQGQNPVGRSHPKNSSRATLNDIARQAGVSVSTVSLVLANKAKERRISADVSSRVLQAAASLDYSPNLLVHSLQRGKTHVLSFFNGFRLRGQNDLYMDRLSTAIERAGGRLGYDILVHCDFSRTAEEIYRKLNGGRSDGLIFFAPQTDDPLLPALRGSRLPVVLVNGIDEAESLSAVKDDVREGMRQVAAQLIRLGHRRIAALTNIPWGNKDAVQRLDLLRAFLCEAGIVIPDRWAIRNAEANTAESVLRFLLNEPEPPTALFCWHDRLGYQVLELCEDLGVSVPEQLSVIGYDGLHWPAKTRHTLASVSVDLDALADLAVVLLDRLIQRKEEAPVQRLLPVVLTAGTTLVPPATFD